MLQGKGINRNIDWITFSLYLGLVILGWVMIYSVSQDELSRLSFFRSSAGKQLIWMFISFAAIGIITIIDWKFWQTFAYPIYALTLLFLLGVPFLGVTIKGATSWYSFAGMTLQPAEFAKFGTCLAIAAYLSSNKANLKKINSQIVTVSLFLLPSTMIMLQPDLGSAIVFFSFFLVLYREGLPGSYYIIGAILAATLIIGLVAPTKDIWMVLLGLGMIILTYQLFEKKPLLIGAAALLSAFAYFAAREWGYTIPLIVMGSLIFFFFSYYTIRGNARFSALLASVLIGCGGLSYAANYSFNNILKPHQQDRINVWLQPQLCDPRGSLYNVVQSKMAISSGGFSGKGALKGNMTKYHYVPEQITDFIFCTIGEEHGFIGTMVILGMFMFLLLRLITLAERQRSNFSRIYAYGLVGIIFLHFVINIGMTMGLAPIIGIPLPFISKGGSALLGFSIMIGILLKLDSRRFHI